MGMGEYLEMKTVSDTQRASHALARAIVKWNLRNAFDQYMVSVSVRLDGNKTATREEKQRTEDVEGRGYLMNVPSSHNLRIQHLWKLNVVSCTISI